MRMDSLEDRVSSLESKFRILVVVCLLLGFALLVSGACEVIASHLEWKP